MLSTNDDRKEFCEFRQIEGDGYYDRTRKNPSIRPSDCCDEISFIDSVAPHVFIYLFPWPSFPFPKECLMKRSENSRYKIIK